MTIRHLHIFLTVASCKSMSLAASTLYLSQPTVSQAIKDLEVHYGTLLFERLSKRLYITDSGKQLQAYAKVLLAQFNTLEDAMQHEALAKHFHLGATITCGCCLLPSLLEEFRLAQPQVELLSCIQNTRTIEEMLLHGELDAAIVEGVIDHKDLMVKPLVDDCLVLACSTSHPLAAKQTFEPKDLEGQHFVMREKGSGTRALFDKYLMEHKINIICKVEAPFPEAMKQAILYNNCLAVMSVRLLEKEIQNKTIHIFPCPSKEWNRSFSLVYHKDKYISDSIYFLNHLLPKYKLPEIKLFS